jgi:hypothetical protein
MPFDYETVTGLIDKEKDSEAVQGYKAGTGALIYALRNAGWSPTQIANGLRTHFDGVSAVLAEQLAEMGRNEPGTDYAAGLYAAEMTITPLPYATHCQCTKCLQCPCRPHYCNACVPEETTP